MKIGLERPITAAALLCSLALTACGGSQNGLLPNASVNQSSPRHTDGAISHESPDNGANSGICGTSGVGLDCANQPGVTDPGPLASESACDPSAGDICGLNGIVAANSSCPGALAKDTTSDGTNNHNSMISNRMALWFDTSVGNSIFAYEYQTYGGKEYIEFNGSISGALGVVGFNSSAPTLFNMSSGSWITTLQNALSKVGKSMSNLPAPYNQISQTAVHQIECATTVS